MNFLRLTFWYQQSLFDLAEVDNVYDVINQKAQELGSGYINILEHINTF